MISQLRFTVRQCTHNCPNSTLQLAQNISVLIFQTMVTDEIGEISKVAFLIQNQASFFSADQLSVEVRWQCAIEAVCD